MTMLEAISPDGRNAIRVETDFTAVILRDGLELARVGIGLDATCQPPVGAPQITATMQDLSADTPFYTKRAHISLTANTAKAAWTERSLILLATDQGVAYRWELARPAQIDAETFDFKPASFAELLFAYNNGAYEGDLLQNSWETIHNRGPLDAVDPARLVYLPLTLLFPHAAMAVTEAELRAYPGLNLQREGDRFHSLMARWPTSQDGSSRRYSRVLTRADYLVQTSEPRALPWRIFMLGNCAADLYDNDLVEALSEPPKGDFSWVKTGQVAWDWWNDWGLDGVEGFKPGVNTATYKYYIDFAAAYNIEYVILDEGWAQELDVTKVIPEVDIPALVAHGRAKGVGIILWSTWQQLIDRQEEIFSRYAAMGVKGFKIDFHDRDDAQVADFLYKTAEVAAGLHLLVDYHGIHKPTGLSHTWPNVVSYEGVFGLENCKWTSNRVDFITNDIRLAFGRLLAGPMDYTPGAMRNAPRAVYRADGHRPMSMGTRCRQAALAMLFDTNLRMLCDSPTAYEREPAYTRFVTAVPVDWDETRCEPSSDPDTHLQVMRRRGSEVWHAAIVGTQPRTLKVTFDAPARVTLVRDAPTSDVVGTDYILEAFDVEKPGELEIPCASGGGFLLRAVARA